MLKRIFKFYSFVCFKSFSMRSGNRKHLTRVLHMILPLRVTICWILMNIQIRELHKGFEINFCHFGIRNIKAWWWWWWRLRFTKHWTKTNTKNNLTKKKKEEKRALQRPKPIICGFISSSYKISFFKKSVNSIFT